VQEEESRILVDTGSSVTIISANFFDRIAGKLDKKPVLVKVNYKIQGVTGHLEQPRGEVKNLPLKFSKNGPYWELNACITEAATTDIILGTNFLIKHKASLDIMEKQLTLRRMNGTKEVVPLVEKTQFHIRSVNVTEKMVIDPNPNWKCKKGPNYFKCMPAYIPDDQEDYRKPCSKCQGRWDEERDYEDAKQKYSDYKYEAHSDGCRSYYAENVLTGAEEIQEAYAVYVPGTTLKPSGEVSDKTTTYGNVGKCWTNYHPEWKTTAKRKKDPDYAKRTELWKQRFLRLPEPEPMELDEPRKEVYRMEVPYVMHPRQKRQVTCEIQDSGCIIDNESIEWEEIRKMQAKFTRRPENHERKYHYKGPGTRCWDRENLNDPKDHCSHCVWMVQSCRTISQLPDDVLTRLEKEEKIRARVRLQPLEKVYAPYPTPWTRVGIIEYRRWTPESKAPTPMQGGYVLYSNKDVLVHGSMSIPTGIDLRFPPHTMAILTPYNPSATYMTHMMTIQSEQRVEVHVIAPNPSVVNVKQAIAQFTLISSLNPEPEIVATGQKAQEQPSPFLKTLTPDQDHQLEALQEEYKDIFAEELNQLGQATLIQHRIETIPGRTAFQKRYRQSWENEDFIAAEVKRMVEAKIIEPTEVDIEGKPGASAFAAPVVIVGKKDGSKRFCVDYRRLNDITETNPYPLPIIEEIFSDIAQYGTRPKYFTALDLASGYWQVPMFPEHIHKTTFTCHLGLFSFLRLPFGLKNAPASFQCMMDTIFREQIGKFIAVFIDDINIFSHTFEEHLDHVRTIFDKCRKYGLRIKKKKCHFGCERLEFLGHMISSTGLLVDERKVDAILQYGTPKNVKQIRRFLGMTGYYARFVNGYQELAAPMIKLTRKAQRFEWTKEQQQAFQGLKDALATAPILAFPNRVQPFTLTTDASDFALGAILSQWDEQDQADYAIAYASKAMSKSEKNYNTTHREGLAVNWAIKKFQRYLSGRPFKVVTDHAALISILKKLEPVGRTGRWAMNLQEYSFTIEHRKGAENVVADALSRDPKFEQEGY